MNNSNFSNSHLFYLFFIQIWWQYQNLRHSIFYADGYTLIKILYCLYKHISYIQHLQIFWTFIRISFVRIMLSQTLFVKIVHNLYSWSIRINLYKLSMLTLLQCKNKVLLLAVACISSSRNRKLSQMLTLFYQSL